MIPLFLLALFFWPLAAAEDRCALSGIVVDSVTGEPLSKVRVQLVAVDGIAGRVSYTTSDAKGRFTLVDLDPGGYRLKGARSGYLESFYGSHRFNNPGIVIRLQEGQAQRDLKLKLLPTAVISGTIRDTDAEPLPDVKVAFSRWVAVGGRERMERVDSFDTDDQGQYRLRNLPPGRYYIGAEPVAQHGVDHSVRGESPPETLVTTFYSGATDPSLATPIELSVGAHVAGMDITLARARTFRITGRVTNAKDATLVLVSRNGAAKIEGFEIRTTTKNAEGDFELPGVLPGAWQLFAFDGGSREGRIPLDVGNSDIAGVRIALAPGVELKGQIRIEGGKKVALGGGRVYFSGNESRGVVSVEVATDLSFVGHNMRPDRYTISVAGLPAGHYVRSIHSGDAEVMASGLTVSGSGIVALDIGVASDGGNVSGVVLDKDEQPVAGATVLMRAGLDLHADTDQYGRYEFNSVPPGDYTIYGWEDVEPEAWNDPVFMKDFEGKGQKLTVKPNGSEIVKLRVGPAR